MKCPFQTVETVESGRGNLKSVVFADCLENECPFYEKVMYKELDGSKPPRFQVYCNAAMRTAK